MNEKKEFEVGDVVHLKSGGPPMTVASIDEGIKDLTYLLHCGWFDGVKSEHGVFWDRMVFRVDMNEAKKRE